LRRLLVLLVLVLTVSSPASTPVLQGSTTIYLVEPQPWVISGDLRGLVFSIDDELVLWVEAPLEVALGARALVNISLHAMKRDIVVQELMVVISHRGSSFVRLHRTIEVGANSTWTDTLALYGEAPGPATMSLRLVYDGNKTFGALFVVTVVKGHTCERLLELYSQALEQYTQALRENIELRHIVAHLKDELEYCRREQYRLKELSANITVECGRLVSDVERRCEERTSSLEVEKARLMGELDRCKAVYRDLLNYYNELLKVFEELRADGEKAWARVTELEGMLNTSLAGNVALSIALALLAVFAFKRRAH